MKGRLFLLAGLLLLVIFNMPNVTGQQNSGKKRIRVENSDSTNYLTTDTGEIVYFWGNVIMEHNNAFMYCDSAILFPNGIFEAYSNAKVVRGETSVLGDVIIYDNNNDLAEVSGRIVFLTNGSSTLRTTKVDFNTATEVGYFENEGTIVDSFRLLESKQGYYYSKLKEFEFIGTVQADTEDYLLISDSMTYNTDSKIFNFFSNTHIWSNSGYLYCDKGWFNSDNNTMYFLKNSYMLTNKQEVFADSIYYDDATRKGRLYSNIQVEDTTQRTIAMADLAKFDMNTEDFIMEKNPSFIMYDENKDSAYIRADTIYSITLPMPVALAIDSAFTGFTEIDSALVVTDSLNMADTASIYTERTNVPADTIKSDTLNVQSQKDSTYKELYAFRNVRLFRNDFQMVCDSMYFNSLDSIWKMYYNPILWDGDKMQITSDSMKFFIKNGDLYLAKFQTNAMIVSPKENPDSTQYFDQIKSKNMDAYLVNRKIRTLDVLGNAQTKAFSLEDYTMNTATATSLRITFDSITGRVRRIAYYSDVEADNNPLMLVPVDDLSLPGFKWNGALRPKSGREVINRILKPTEREERESIPKPTFPITERIDLLESEASIN